MEKTKDLERYKELARQFADAHAKQQEAVKQKEAIWKQTVASSKTPYVTKAQEEMLNAIARIDNRIEEVVAGMAVLHKRITDLSETMDAYHQYMAAMDAKRKMKGE